MAQEYRRKCPDCLNTDWKKTFASLNRGDGHCGNCGGSGQKWFNTCEICNGTGQCQTCGGTGYEYYSDDEYPTNSSNQRETSYYDTGNSYQTSSSANYSRKKEIPETLKLFIMIAGLIVLVLIIRACEQHYNNIGNRRYNTQVNQQTAAANNTSPAVMPIPQCQSDGTGDCTFVNQTNDTISVEISHPTWWKTINVPPNQLVTFSGIPASIYPYDYKYYYKEQSGSTERGTVLIQECATAKLNMNLPTAYWYTVGSDWQKIDIPNECCYVFIVPDRKYFGIKFYDDDTQHVGVSWVTVPDSTERIYVRSLDSSIIKVSIQKNPAN